MILEKNLSWKDLFFYLNPDQWRIMNFIFFPPSILYNFPCEITIISSQCSLGRQIKNTTKIINQNPAVISAERKFLRCFKVLKYQKIK